MKTKKTLVVFLALLLGGSSIANAQSRNGVFSSTLTQSQVESSLNHINPDALNSNVDVHDVGGNLSATVDNQKAEIPLNSEEPVSVSSEEEVGRELSVSLPFSDEVEDVKKIGDNSVLFENSNNTVNTVSIREDASVQIHVVIGDASAPTRYPFEVDVPAGGKIELDESGVAIIADAEGEFWGGVAPAWAKDANGNSVPTWFEIDGDSLVQVVDHTGVTAFPVVADPWFGVNLFSSIWRDWYNNDFRYNGNVSFWGGAIMLDYGRGQYIMRTFGWAEWMKKYPEITNKATLKHQYDCHVAAGTFGLPFTGTYNLERFRRDNPKWPSNVWNHRCNW